MKYWQAGLKHRSHRFWSVLVGALGSLWREGELVAVEFNLGAGNNLVVSLNGCLGVTNDRHTLSIGDG